MSTFVRRDQNKICFLSLWLLLPGRLKTAICTVVKTTEYLTYFWSDEQRTNFEEASPEREWHSRVGEKQSGNQKVCVKALTQYMAETWSIETKLSFNRKEQLLQSHNLHNGGNHFNFFFLFSLIKNF